VRSGFSYYPQSLNVERTLTAVGFRDLPNWAPYGDSAQPYRTWICVPLFKQSQIDPKKSMIVDAISQSGLDNISHRSGRGPAGINATFGDGHVAWQGFRTVTDGFDPNVLDQDQPEQQRREYALRAQLLASLRSVSS
jgi:prepilin-type processing-associated H-X9-DG protein